MRILRKLTVLFLGAVLVLPRIAPAQSGTWTNTVTGNWSVGGNWSGGIVADGPGSTADFSTVDITSAVTIHLDSTRTNGNLTFGDITTNSAAGWTLDNNGNGANILTLAGGTPTISVNALGGTNVATISCVIAGSSGLIKTNPGTLRLIGANSYTGGTFVNSGTLSINNNTAVNNQNVTLNGTILFEDQGNTVPPITVGPAGGIFTNASGHGGGGHYSLPNDITGTGNLYYYGYGDDRFGPSGGRYAYSLSGDFVIMNVQDGMQIAASFSNSTVDVRDPVSMGAVGNPVWGGLKGTSTLALANYTGTFFIGNNNSNTTFSGAMSGSLPWMKIGTGRLTLNGANTCTGSLTVSNGVLAVGASGSINSITNITISTNCVLNVAARTTFTNSAAATYIFCITPAGAGSAGRIEADGLDISSAKVVLTNVTGSVLDDAVYVLATYTNLTGSAFASTNGIPDQYGIKYNYSGNQIVLARQFNGLVIQIR